MGNSYLDEGMWHSGFSRRYTLDFGCNEFVTLDATSGEHVAVGIAHTLPDHHWTGLTVVIDGTFRLATRQRHAALLPL
jgi:hypothetical protein